MSDDGRIWTFGAAAALVAAAAVRSGSRAVRLASSDLSRSASAPWPPRFPAVVRIRQHEPENLQADFAYFVDVALSDDPDDPDFYYVSEDFETEEEAKRDAFRVSDNLGGSKVKTLDEYENTLDVLRQDMPGSGAPIRFVTLDRAERFDLRLDPNMRLGFYMAVRVEDQWLLASGAGFDADPQIFLMISRKFGQPSTERLLREVISYSDMLRENKRLAVEGPP